MKAFFLAITLLTSSLPASIAEELWVLQVDSAGKAALLFQQPDEKPLSFMSYYIKFDTVSDEVALQFQKDYPALWKAATKSSGNMHNPEVLPLRTKFTEVLLKTATIRRLDNLARESGYTISGAEHEKFHLMKKDDKTKVFAVIWLKFTKLAEQDAAAKP